MPPTLSTERLILRPFLEADFEAAYAVLEGHPDVWKFDPGYSRTREDRFAILRRYVADNDEDGVGTLAVMLRRGGVLIGYVGLQLYLLPVLPASSPEVELFYKLGHAFWGQGYAREACREMIRFAFENLRLQRIVTVTNPHNVRSLHLMTSLGMRIEPAPPDWLPNVIGILDNELCAG